MRRASTCSPLRSCQLATAKIGQSHGAPRLIPRHRDHDRQGRPLGFQKLDVAAVVENDAAGNPLFKVSQLWGTADGIATVGTDINPGRSRTPGSPARAGCVSGSSLSCRP